VPSAAAVRIQHVRVVFTAYLLFILAGLAFFITIGLTHH
jgi:hypothetical protein